MPPEAGFPSNLTRRATCHGCGAVSPLTAHVCPECGLAFERPESSSEGHVFLAQRFRLMPLAALGLGGALVVIVPLFLDGPLFNMPDAVFGARVLGWMLLGVGSLLAITGADLLKNRP